MKDRTGVLIFEYIAFLTESATECLADPPIAPTRILQAVVGWIGLQSQRDWFAIPDSELHKRYRWL